MKKILILLALSCFSSVSWAEAPVSRTTQGFETYAESGKGIEFSCKNQCFILLGGKGDNDYIAWSGKITGSGSVGYGFLNGQQIIPGEFRTVISEMKMNERMLFSDNQYYSQIPKEFPTVIVINGEIVARDIFVNLWTFTLSERVAKNWDRFWKTENLSQYSINLLYGYFVWEVSLTWILSLLLIIVIFSIVAVYSFDRRRFFAPIFFTGMVFVVLYDVREQINLFEVRNGYYDSYVNIPVLEQKKWFGIGYYPDLLEKADQYVSHTPIGQKIYLAAIQNFPLFGYSQYRLHPAETIFVEDMKTVESAKKWDIFIRYGSPLSVADGWEMIYISPDAGAALYVKQ